MIWSWWMLAVDRVVAHVVERVVHPAHVPFVAEAQPAHVDRPRDHRPGGRFLGNGRGARIAAEHFGVDAPQERDRVEVFAPALAVRDPAALRPAVVEVEHRGDRIDAQRVDAVAIEPEQGVREQEIGDLGAAQIVDERVPVDDGGLASGRRARRAPCRRTGRARADRRENARAPSRGSRRARRGGRRR